MAAMGARSLPAYGPWRKANSEAKKNGIAQVRWRLPMSLVSYAVLVYSNGEWVIWDNFDLLALGRGDDVPLAKVAADSALASLYHTKK